MLANDLLSECMLIDQWTLRIDSQIHKSVFYTLTPGLFLETIDQENIHFYCVSQYNSDTNI